MNLTYRDHSHIQEVPDALEVQELMHPDLQDLLDDVVDDEGDEDQLAGQDEVVPGGDIAEELDGPERLRVEDAAGRRELEGQSE